MVHCGALKLKSGLHEVTALAWWGDADVIGLITCNGHLRDISHDRVASLQIEHAYVLAHWLTQLGPNSVLENVE